MRRASRDPRFPAEWQEAVDGARLLLVVDAMRQYGLVEGGPLCNAGRCVDMLRRGRRLGYRPNEETVDAALRELVALPEVKVMEELETAAARGRDHAAETERRRTHGDLTPGCRVVMTPLAVADGLHQRGTPGGRGQVFNTVFGEFVRAGRPREDDLPALLVRLAGAKTPRPYRADYWRRISEGEDVNVAELIAEGAALQQRRQPTNITGLAMTREPEADPSLLVKPEPDYSRITTSYAPPMPPLEHVGNGYWNENRMPDPEDYHRAARAIGAGQLVVSRPVKTQLDEAADRDGLPRLEEGRDVTVYEPPEDDAPAAAPASGVRDADGRLLYPGDDVAFTDEAGDLFRGQRAQVCTIRAPRLTRGAITVRRYRADGELLKVPQTVMAADVRRAPKAPPAAPVVVTIHAAPDAAPETRAALDQLAHRAAAQLRRDEPAEEPEEADEPEEPALDPEMRVWAINPHYAPPRPGQLPNVSGEVSRRRCRLRDVPPGWRWEVCDDDAD